MIITPTLFRRSPKILYVNLKAAFMLPTDTGWVHLHHIHMNVESRETKAGRCGRFQVELWATPGLRDRSPSRSSSFMPISPCSF